MASSSADYRHIYFSSGAVLTTIPNGHGEHASNSGENIYGYDTETGETKYVASASVVAGGRVNEQQAQVTSDGRYLIFATLTHLSNEDTTSGASIYRYDFQTSEVTWISHAASGFAITDEGDNAILPVFEEEREGADADFGDSRRAVSENGEYVIFRTAEKLQADDVSGAPQVYLWHDGTVSLISDGTNLAGVTEAPGMSASGSDIVFATTTRLVGQDTDNLQDIYDARIDGGFPAPKPEPSCSGEACQGNPSSAPTFGVPGTQSFTGSGNKAAPPFKEVLEQESKPKSKALTRAQKLARSLSACGRDRVRKKRRSCEAGAYKKFGPKSRAKGAKKE